MVFSVIKYCYLLDYWQDELSYIKKIFASMI